MTCRQNQRQRHGSNWRSRRITPTVSGRSGWFSGSENWGNDLLLDDRSAIRRALHALLKELNVIRLQREMNDEAGHCGNPGTGQSADRHPG